MDDRVGIVRLTGSEKQQASFPFRSPRFRAAGLMDFRESKETARPRAID
jgi:hypothetical protein